MQDLKPISSYNASVSFDGNVTTSYMRYTPDASHHGQTLTCRGSNEEMLLGGSASTQQIAEDHHQLQIYCKIKRELCN